VAPLRPRGKLLSFSLLTSKSGGINLQTVRHEEGKVLHVLKKHTSAVSVLCLTNDEQSLLSGSWDRQVHV
jgi:transcriptional activator SPT8